MKAEILPKENAVRVTADFKTEPKETVLGAAYVLSDRSYAHLEPAKGGVKVTMTLKKPASAGELEAFAELYAAELETQKVRWEISRNNLPIREYIVQQAILQAQGKAQPPAPPAAPAPEELSTEQKAEIDRLIAEVEAEIREMGQKREVLDPKGISATWEEKHGSKG